MSKMKTLLFIGFILASLGSAYSEPVVTVHLSYNNSAEVEYITTTNSTPDLHESEGSLKAVFASEDGEAIFSQNTGLPIQTSITEKVGTDRTLSQSQRINYPYYKGSDKLHLYLEDRKVGEFDIPKNEISPQLRTENINGNNGEKKGIGILENRPNLFYLIIFGILLTVLIIYLSVVPEE